MVANLKFFLAFLALVGCDDAKVKLEISSIANFDKSADIGDFTVTVKKDGKTDEDSKLVITVKIVRVLWMHLEQPPHLDLRSKKRAATKGVATFKKDDFDIAWSKGKHKVTASGEGAEGASKEFEVTGGATRPPIPKSYPEVYSSVIGKEFQIFGGTGTVNLPTSGCGLELIRYDYQSDTAVPGAIGNNKDKLFAVGGSDGTGCTLKIGTVTVKKGTTDVTAFTATPAHAVKAVLDGGKIKVNDGADTAEPTYVTDLRVFARDEDTATSPWVRIGDTITANGWHNTGIDQGDYDEVLVYFKKYFLLTLSPGENHWLLHFEL